jgi:hypothetical protein
MKEDEMGGEYRREKKCIGIFCREILKEELTWKT